MPCMCWAGRRYSYLWTNDVISHQDFAAESLRVIQRVSRRPAIRCFSSVKVAACDIFNTFREAMVAPAWEADRNDLPTEGDFKTWPCDEPAAEPATDFVAFLGHEAGALLTTVDEGGSVSAPKLFCGPPAEVIETLLVVWLSRSINVHWGWIKMRGDIGTIIIVRWKARVIKRLIRNCTKRWGGILTLGRVPRVNCLEMIPISPPWLPQWIHKLPFWSLQSSIKILVEE